MATKLFLPERVLQFVKFCLVGGSGVLVDMAVLFVLADPKPLALNIAFGKVCAGRNENAITFVIWLGLTGMAVALPALGRHSKRVLARAPYLLVPLFLVVRLASLVSGNACAAIQLSGEIASDYYSPQGHPINHGLSKFRVVRDGSRWQLITEQASSESLCITSDGNTVFTVISATNASPVRVARGATNVNARMQVGIIDPWSFPLHTPAESLPWWFFVLSRETDLRLSDLPTPWTVPRSDPQAYFCSNSVTWSVEHPGLVASAAFFYSADKVQSALDSPCLNKQSQLLVSLEEVRMLAAVLRNCTNLVKAGEASVLDWTNSQHGKFPLKFECVVYDSLAEQLFDPELRKFRVEQAARVPTLRIKYHGKVTSIADVASFEHPPPLRTPTWVADNRFRNAQGRVQRVEYGPVEGWIMDPSQVAKRAMGHFRF